MVPVQLEAPVRAAWAVDSSADGPRVNVTVTSLLDRDCTVNVQLHAPRLSRPAHSNSTSDGARFCGCGWPGTAPEAHPSTRLGEDRGGIPQVG